MFKFVMRAFAALALIPVSAALAASGNSKDLLSYVPADSPYVLAVLDPLPDALADKIEPATDAMLAAYKDVLRGVLDTKLAEMDAEGDDQEAAERFTAVMQQFIGLMDVEALRSAGIQRESAFVMYGNGLLPVIRFELGNTKAFEALVADFEESAGETLQIGSVDGQEYKYAGDDKARVILATRDQQAILTLVPTAFDDAQLGNALGLKKPRNSLKKSKDYRAMLKEYGYSKKMNGFVDIEKLAAIILGDGSDADNAILTALEFEQPPLSAVCKTEFMSIAAIAPRVVMGYTSIGKDSVQSSAVVEMRGDIAQGLSKLSAVVPGLGLDTGALIAFGMSLNPLELRNFYEARLDAMEADPYECEALADLQGGVAQGRELLQQPIPPMAYSFRGFVANVDDMHGMDFASGTPPTSIDGTLLLAVENAQALMMMGAMMDPQIAELNLMPDGKAVSLSSVAEAAGLPTDAFAALSEDALSISLGEGAEQNSAAQLTAKSAQPSPLMSMNMDASRYYALIAESMMQEDNEAGGEEMPLEMRTALRDAMVLSGDIYDRIAVDVHLTDRGIEIGSRMTLGD